MKAGFERPLHDVFVRRRGGRNHRGVETVAPQHRVEVAARRHRRVALPHQVETVGASIADDRELGARQVAEHARVIGSPAAETDQTDPQTHRTNINWPRIVRQLAARCVRDSVAPWRTSCVR